MKRFCKRHKTELFLYFGFFLIHLLLMQAAKMPLMYGDECGYLGWARNLLYGYSDGGRTLPGYSLFLIPVLAVSDSVPAVYPLILLINGLIGAFVPVGCLHLARKFALTERQATVCAILCGCYPAILLYANMALCEILLTTLFVLFLLRLTAVAERPHSFSAWLGLLAVTVGLLLTHTRAVICLPILAVCLPVILPDQWRRRTLIVGGVLLAAGVAVGTVLLAGGGVNADHLREQIGGLVTLRGIKDFCYAVCSQGTYLIWATFALGMIGIGYAIVLIVRREQGWKTAWCIAVSVLAMAALSAVYMSHHERPVHLLYGRYNDCLTPAALLLGLVCVCRREKKPLLALIPAVAAVAVTGWKQAALLDGFAATPQAARIAIGSVDSEPAQVFGIGLYRLFLRTFGYWQVCLIFAALTLVLLLLLYRTERVGRIALAAVFLLGILTVEKTYFADWSASRAGMDEVLRAVPDGARIKVVGQEENGLGYAWEYDRYRTENPTLLISTEEEGQPYLLTRQSDYPYRLVTAEREVNCYLWDRTEPHREPDYRLSLTCSEEGRVTLSNNGDLLLCYAAAHDLRSCGAVMAAWYREDGSFLYSDRLELSRNLLAEDSEEWALQPPSEAVGVWIAAMREGEEWLTDGLSMSVLHKKGRTVFVRSETEYPPCGFDRIEWSHLKESETIPHTTWQGNLIGFEGNLIGRNSAITGICCPVTGDRLCIVTDGATEPMTVSVNGGKPMTAPAKDGIYSYPIGAVTCVTDLTLCYEGANEWKRSEWRVLDWLLCREHRGARLERIEFTEEDAL